MADERVFMMGNFRAVFPTDRRYAANHMWAQPVGGVVRFGLSAYAVRLLQEVFFLEWTVAAGAVVREKDEIGAIESAKANAALFAPMAGAITRFNDAVMADPSLINKSGYDEGWLFEMTGEAGGTMDAPAYVASLEASWARAQALLKGQMK